MLRRTARTLSLLLLLPAPALAATIVLPQSAVGERVVDGDTLVVKAGGKEYDLRLIGIDAPEAHPSAKLDHDAEHGKDSKETILEQGKRATEFLRKLCEGKACGLTYDPVNEPNGYRDKYGRLLVYVWIKDSKGRPRLVNGVIVRAGYASALLDFPFHKDLREAFQRAEREAKAAGRGLWRRGKPEPVPEPAEDEQVFVASRRGKTFHKPECPSAQRIKPENLVTFQSTVEARTAGCVPCKTCLPE